MNQIGNTVGLLMFVMLVITLLILVIPVLSVIRRALAEMSGKRKSENEVDELVQLYKNIGYREFKRSPNSVIGRIEVQRAYDSINESNEYWGDQEQASTPDPVLRNVYFLDDYRKPKNGKTRGRA